MPQEQPDQMSPEEALGIVRGACEIAGEAPADHFSLDDKVRLASARNLVEAFFKVGLDTIRQAAAAQNVKPGPTPLKKHAAPDETRPGESPIDTIRRRAKEEAEKQKAERLAEPEAEPEEKDAA